MFGSSVCSDCCAHKADANLDQTELHPLGHPGLVMLRRDEKPQDFQEIWVNPVFILFPAGCFEQFNLTERQNPLIASSKSRHNIWGSEEEGEDKWVR